MRLALLSLFPAKYVAYAVAGGLFLALGAVIVWRIFAAGENAQKADAAIAGLNKAIIANQAKTKAQQSPRSERANDPANRDTWT